MKDIRRARVYQIINRITGHSYIGSTKNKIATRWNWHLERLKNNIHEIREWQDAWNDSNVQEWDFRVLEDNIPVEEQFEKELEWQNTLNPTFGSKTYWHRKHHGDKVERVMALLIEGKTYREIASLCDVSVGWISIVKDRYIGSISKRNVHYSEMYTGNIQKNN
jgi:hypothetical protein